MKFTTARDRRRSRDGAIALALSQVIQPARGVPVLPHRCASTFATRIRHRTFNAQFTKREDISELLFSSMALENTVAGLLPIGEPFRTRMACRWTEDALQLFQWTDTTAGGRTPPTRSHPHVTVGHRATRSPLARSSTTPPDPRPRGFEYVQVSGVNATRSP